MVFQYLGIRSALYMKGVHKISDVNDENTIGCFIFKHYQVFCDGVNVYDVCL